jgi:hypothetical protein
MNKPRNQSEITPEYHNSIIEAFKRLGSQRAVARELGLHRASVQAALRREAKFHDEGAAPDVPLADDLPADDVSIDEIIALQSKRFEARHAHTAAKRWRRFTIPTAGPYALMFFGDPHVDDNGCNWPLLQAHCDLARDTEALYAINIGDTTNNWAGRLARLWAEQDTSSSTARKLAKWLLSDSGVPWFLWLHGNHDLWDGPVGASWFEAKRPHFVAMEDWQAKVTLASPNGYELRLWAAHNFKGNSIWNNMHGLERAAQMQDWAHLYVAGHHHDVGLRQGENPHRNFCYWLARARGYKFLDHYAELHGFGHHQHGASVLAVIDPEADQPNAVQCFLDPFEGAEFLKWKRSK